MTVTSTSVITRAVVPADLPEITALSALVFGPGRFGRTAYRVREGTPDISPFCRVAIAAGQIIASIRMTEITIGGKGGALLLGPLAVDPDYANQGYGRRLIAESVDVARRAERKLVLLVGDLPYYGRLGFVAVPPGRVQLPGPVDPARLLALELETGAALSYEGMVTGVPASNEPPGR